MAAIRAGLHAHSAHALLVPSSDPHLSEYLPEHWQAREWASGFTGSMGTLVVTLEHAALFADSRYWSQAQAELQGSGIELEKIPTTAATYHTDWLARHSGNGTVVMVDGQVLALAAEKALRTALDAVGATLRTDIDLFDSIWDTRPALPTGAVYEHLEPYVGEARADKLAQVRAAVDKLGCNAHFVSSVDDIAWLLNLRGSDVSYNPVFIAHLLLRTKDCTLFVAEGKVDAALRARLSADGVALAPYADAPRALAALGSSDHVLLDPKRVTYGLRQHIAQSVQVVEAINPSVLLKSRKNAAQAQFVREAMRQDGAAMSEFYAWFEQALQSQSLTELDVAEHLSAARARRAGFMDLSFPVIAGFNANGALPHYRATEEAHARIEGSGLLLIDSGGQYLGGTTDITRTWAIGSVSAQQRRDYTAVLQGTMALSRTVFPVGTLSPALDAIARTPLWALGLDYGHGTGHGVGYFLNVHEGPQSISKVAAEPHHAMQPGMITSIEPGLYRESQWGVRIENLVLNVPHATPENDAFGAMLAFETLTLCPIDTTCIERGMLRADEVQWLNQYHATVRERLAPLLTGDALAWLQRRTQPL
ncbi:MAG: aminopeptidase family protein P [Burkholderiales bacterium]|nr:aminopeptidase family protein P [Burkholderiales bacterium]